MTLKTHTYNIGYKVECCPSDTSSGSTISVDLTPITQRLDTLIGSSSTRNSILANILSDTNALNGTVTQTTVTTSVAGSIPIGVKSYQIYNLGVTPTSPTTTYNSWTVDGDTIPENRLSYANDAGTKSFTSAINYDPNGNTLLIIYNS